MPPEEHALLSASSAERWMHCTPAPKLEAQLPDSASEYAEEGRLAHALAELKLRKHFTEPMGERTYKSKLKKLQADPRYNPEMEGCTDAYLDYVKAASMAFANRPFVAVECRLDFSSFVPDGFGTGDCILIGGDTLHIIDYKHGKGVPVEAEGNPQIRLYALGALLSYGMLYDLQHIKMTIFQPRLGEPSEAEMLRDDLLNWAAFEVRPRAAEAYAGEGNFAPGDWCRFCKARHQCRARTAAHLTLGDFKSAMPPLLSDEEVGEILARAQTLAKWVGDLESYALDALLAGKTIPGWKVVEGRSNRCFTDVDKALEAAIKAGYPQEMLYITKPETLSKLEELLGKKNFGAVLGGYIMKPPGKPTLAIEKDKRPEFRQASAAKDFAGVPENRQGEEQ